MVACTLSVVLFSIASMCVSWLGSLQVVVLLLSRGSLFLGMSMMFGPVLVMSIIQVLCM